MNKLFFVVGLGAVSLLSLGGCKQIAEAKKAAEALKAASSHLGKITNLPSAIDFLTTEEDSGTAPMQDEFATEGTSRKRRTSCELDTAWMIVRSGAACKLA